MGKGPQVRSGRGWLEGWLKEEISPLCSSCPLGSHSKQTVHVHRNSSIFPMCWADPVTSPVQPRLPFTIQQTSVCVLHSTPRRELGVQAKHLPWRGVRSSLGDRPQTCDPNAGRDELRNRQARCSLKTLLGGVDRERSFELRPEG